MKAVSRWLDRFCYDHPNFGVPNLMKYIVIGNVMVYFLDLFSRGYASWMLSFSSQARDRKSTRLNSSHRVRSRMPSSA